MKKQLIGIAAAATQTFVWACDLTSETVALARKNVEKHKLSGRIAVLEGDLFAPLENLGLENSVDLIVANPPYVAATDSHLAALRHEPRNALVAGNDGLDALRRVIAGAPAHLDASGWLIVEHGNSQGGSVRDLFRAAEFRDIATYRDLAGHDRATVGRR